MKVAIFGCLHGMLDEMYKSVQSAECHHKTTIDFIIVCGDCQTIRHFDDLKCLSVPDKYKKVGDFHQYYSGAKKIPKLTIFVGGNHEASNYLMTLPYGGWVCDNFYYLGYAGVIRYKGFRIAGISGIYNRSNCNRGRYERMPLDEQSIKSVYHTRRLDVFRLQILSQNAQEKNPIDIMISHDWPARVYNHGNVEQLLRFKPAFRQDVQSREGLGNPLTETLIKQLKPKRWFAAHLHCKFYAKIVHDKATQNCTEFLSLSKVGFGNFMEILDIDPVGEYDNADNELYYDEEWLTILRKTINLEINSRNNVFCPMIDDDRGKVYVPTSTDIEETIDLMNKTGGFRIPRNFQMWEPVIYHRPHGVQPSLDCNRVRDHGPNNQTKLLTDRLELSKLNESNLKKPEPESSTSKQEPEVIDIEQEISVEQRVKSEVKTEIKSETNIKQESGLMQRSVKVEKEESYEPTIKKQAMHDSSVVDEDGCLPFYIDTRGEK